MMKKFIRMSFEMGLDYMEILFFMKKKSSLHCFLSTPETNTEESTLICLKPGLPIYAFEAGTLYRCLLDQFETGLV